MGPQSPLQEYIREAQRMGIVGTIVSPGPSPETPHPEGLYYPCLWRLEAGKPVYEQVIKKTGGETVWSDHSTQNPYHAANVELFGLARNTTKPVIFVMPIHHPILDTKEEVKAMLYDYPSVALKLHGIATFTGPDDVPEHTINMLRVTNKPVIVHTDRHLGEATNPFALVCKMNDPENWVAWAEKTGVKTILAHGARLTESVIKQAKKLPNVMIGMAPDLLIASDPARLATPTDDYLLTLMDMAGPDKLLFDIDYGWNVTVRDQWDTQDWNMHRRVQTAAQTLNMNPKEVEQIFYQNAVRFFQL